MGGETKKKIKWNSRLIAATSTPIQQLLSDVFVKDFYYRLSGTIIEVPPLRERRCDIKMLIDFYMNEYGELLKVELDNKTIQKLINYDWPGNIRELQSVIKMICASGKSRYKADFLPKHIWDNKPLGGAEQDNGKSLTKQAFNKIKANGLDYFIKDIEEAAVLEALKEKNGHRTNAAKVLGMTRQRISRIIEKLEAQGKYSSEKK